MKIKKLMLTTILISSLNAGAGTITYEFSGTLGERRSISSSDDQSFGEYVYNTPYCGSITYDETQVNSGGMGRGDYTYDQMVLVFPDDSDADSLPNVLIDYGNVTQDPNQGIINVHNHLVNDPDNINSYPTDFFHGYSHGQANGMAISNSGSTSIGGYANQAGPKGISMEFYLQDTDGVMFPDNQGVELSNLDFRSFTDGSIRLRFTDTNDFALPFDIPMIDGPINSFNSSPIFRSHFENDYNEAGINSIQNLIDNCDLSMNYKLLIEPELINLNNETSESRLAINSFMYYKVGLSSQPSADVVVNFSSSDPTEGFLGVNDRSITFTPADWLNKNIVIEGVDDNLIDGDVTYTINGVAHSLDPNYDGKSIQLTMVNLDDD